MTQAYKEPGTPRARDYVIGITVILGLTVAGISIFGLNWGLGGADAPAIWFSLDLTLFVSLGSIIRGIYRLQFKRSQTHRDELAARVANDKREDFCLYLRPFNSTSRLPITLRVTERYTHYPGLSPKTYFEKDEIDLETELARALHPCAPLVALGQPGEHIGAGRIKTDDEKWQSLFLDLASRASAIFVVPATTQGTQWELDRLAGNQALRGKTILIIPPQTIDAHGTPFRSIGGPRSDALKALTARGISLQGVESSQGLLMNYYSTRTFASIATYVTPATQRGLLGWYLNSGYVQERGKVMTLGLRNAIFCINPGLAGRQKLSR